MAPSEPEAVFKVPDRRRRLDDDEAPRPAPAAAEPPQVSPVDLSPAGERSLAGLFMMLASSAVVALGGAPDPLTGQRQVDLAQGPDAIDLPIFLPEKTAGNPSPEEKPVTEGMVYDLQPRFVHAKKK